MMKLAVVFGLARTHPRKLSNEHTPYRGMHLKKTKLLFQLLDDVLGDIRETNIKLIVK